MSITFNSPSVPLARPAYQVGVFRFTPGGSDSEYQLLPNVVCLAVQAKVGADPWSARFRYVFDPLLNFQWQQNFPLRADQVLGIAATGPYVVQQDDRLVVRVYHNDGTYAVFFDGFAQIPQGDIASNVESATFTAQGTLIRLWDEPLKGALMRSAAWITNTTSNMQTRLRAEFNPSGHPNATPLNLDSGTAPQQYPVFLGPIWPPTGTDPANKNVPICQLNGQTLRKWNLGMAVRYCICAGLLQPDGTLDQTYLTLTDMTQLDNLLSTVTPTTKNGVINLKDNTTFTLTPIDVVDYDVTGECWPVAVERLITPHGFQMRFALSTNGTGDPQWNLYLYRTDTVTTVKQLQLQQVGATLDPAQTNVGSFSLVRDSQHLVNAFSLDSAIRRYEVSLILVPLFKIAAADATTPNKWDGSDTEVYRCFGMDECGEGFWSIIKNQWVTGSAFDFSAVFKPYEQKQQQKGQPPPPLFVPRRRPCRGHLLTLDDDQKPLRAQLHVSSNYKGSPQPGLWDGTGTWQEIHSNEWHILPGRLGFKVTTDDPNKWSIGVPKAGDPIAYAVSQSTIHLVEWLAAPTAATPAPIFRFTCVIESDRGLDISSGKRVASPTQFAVRRRIDARDRFKWGVVTKYSALNTNPNPGPKGKDQDPAIDDTTDAQAQSDGMRRAHELPDYAGTVRIPRISTAYTLGDKIDLIQGRNLSLQENAATEAGESNSYPSVVAISWQLDGEQSTTLQLSDVRAEPPPKHRESKDD